MSIKQQFKEFSSTNSPYDFAHFPPKKKRGGWLNLG